MEGLGGRETQAQETLACRGPRQDGEFRGVLVHTVEGRVYVQAQK